MLPEVRLNTPILRQDAPIPLLRCWSPPAHARAQRSTARAVQSPLTFPSRQVGMLFGRVAQIRSNAGFRCDPLAAFRICRPEADILLPARCGQVDMAPIYVVRAPIA
jgi:hypothetical protein